MRIFGKIDLACQRASRPHFCPDSCGCCCTVSGRWGRPSGVPSAFSSFTSNRIRGSVWAAAIPEVLTALRRLLRDRYVRHVAARAVGKMGSAACTPKILAALFKPEYGSYTNSIAWEAMGTLACKGVRLFLRGRWVWGPKVTAHSVRSLAQAMTSTTGTDLH